MCGCVLYTLVNHAVNGRCVRRDPVVKVDRMIRWHYTTTILRLRIGARLTRYRNCKFHNFARTIRRHADGISRYSVPPSADPLLPLMRPKGGGNASQICVERADTITNVSIRHIEYDTIRDAILTCAQKLTRVSLINRMEPTTRKKVEN